MNKKAFIERFKDFVGAKQLVNKNDTTLICVSGGSDSVVLCELFNRSGFKFAIAHCNFQLRGSDSDEDAVFVKKIAEKYNVAFYIENFDTLEFKTQNKLSLEEAARKLRYIFFESIRSNFNYNKIATAHHLNDSIETLVFNLIKGTGIRGITGIPAKNNFIVRPLLFATKEEIEKYAAENNIEFRTDGSNLSNEFHRNKIRNEIIPLFKKINPSLELTMQKNINHFQEAFLIYDEQTKKKIFKLRRKVGKDIYLPIAALTQLSAAATYLHEFLFPYGFNSDQIFQIMNCFGSTGKEFYSNAWRVIVDRKFLIVTEINNIKESAILINSDCKSVEIGDNKLHLEYSNYKKDLHFNDSGKIAYFDADKIEFPLTIRRWQAGDYLYPLGLTKKRSDKPGKKKVSDILTDLKLNLLEKENTKVLLSGEKIIWLVGIRQDIRLNVTDKTSKLLKVKIE